MLPTDQGFMNGYLLKSAKLGDLIGAGAGVGVRTFAEMLDTVKPILLATPPIVGAGLGYLHSKATSPSKLDAKSMQQSIELAELEEMKASLQRRNEVEKLKEQRGATGERSLRI